MLRIRRAFTLVELLVVIAIIGVLAGMMLPAVQLAREAARRTSCANHLDEIGTALHTYHDVHGEMPSGWTSADPEGPGWSWAVALLPQMEQHTVYNAIRRDLPVSDPANAAIRRERMPLFLCPSDPSPRGWFVIGEGEDDHEEEHEEHADHHVDEAHPLFELSRSNYAGVFGTIEIEEAPGNGDGTFYHNSRLPFAQIIDGLSYTIMVGERSSRLGGTTWTGVIPEAAEPLARIVGTADHTPNHPTGHFDDFSSHHPLGAQFLLGDGSVRLINEAISLSAYRALATRAAGDTPPVR